MTLIKLVRSLARTIAVDTGDARSDGVA